MLSTLSIWSFHEVAIGYSEDHKWPQGTSTGQMFWSHSDAPIRLFECLKAILSKHKIKMLQLCVSAYSPFAAENKWFCICEQPIFKGKILSRKQLVRNFGSRDEIRAKGPALEKMRSAGAGIPSRRNPDVKPDGVYPVGGSDSLFLPPASHPPWVWPMGPRRQALGIQPRAHYLTSSYGLSVSPKFSWVKI
jgi:hypothetical protein